MTDPTIGATLKGMGIKPVAFAEMIGRDPRTVRRWCREAAPVEVRALLAMVGVLDEHCPAVTLECFLRASGGCLGLTAKPQRSPG